MALLVQKGPPSSEARCRTPQKPPAVGHRPKAGAVIGGSNSAETAASLNPSPDRSTCECARRRPLPACALMRGMRQSRSRWPSATCRCGSVLRASIFFRPDGVFNHTINRGVVTLGPCWASSRDDLSFYVFPHGYRTALCCQLHSLTIASGKLCLPLIPSFRGSCGPLACW